jgi:predicted DNA-binding ribbon-helix-helix protein
MVFLEEIQHEGLRRLAFERRCTMAALIREALEAHFGKKMNDGVESGIACRSCLDT